jgi:uncharacterized protein YggU (UPF0235/DUF167 family)
VRVTIRVRPGARKPEVGGTYDGALVVKVAAVPEGGRATQAALTALAEALGVPRRDVTLVTGMTNRTKVVEIPDEAAPAFEALTHPR